MSAIDTTSYGSSDLQGSYSYTETLKAVYYGPGSVVTALATLLEELQLKKALIVTGKSLFEDVRTLSTVSVSYILTIFKARRGQ